MSGFEGYDSAVRFVDSTWGLHILCLYVPISAQGRGGNVVLDSSLSLGTLSLRGYNKVWRFDFGQFFGLPFQQGKVAIGTRRMPPWGSCRGGETGEWQPRFCLCFSDDWSAIGQRGHRFFFLCFGLPPKYFFFFLLLRTPLGTLEQWGLCFKLF